MQYAVIARDYTDEKALERRLKVRGDHIALGNVLQAEGKAICGVALLNDAGNMNGSIYIVDFSSEEELHEWLQKEPYVLGKVWEHIEVIPCRGDHRF